jgi:hypothetical protein
LTEIQAYEVLESHKGFELRSYPAHTVVSVASPGDLGAAGMGAFGYLAGYIGGRNQANQAIAMTAPVLQEKKDSGFQVSFVLPKDLQNHPLPLDPRLALETKEPSVMAAIRFSGMASDALFQRKAEELSRLCVESGFKVTSEPLFARYNGPWTPPMLRRNEVLLKVERA